MAPTKSVNGKSLLQVVEEETGENASLCYFCKKCTSGCPLSEHMDVAPHQVMRSIQMDRKETVLRSKTIWVCASCQTCVTRCPQSLDLPRMMDSLKIMAKEEGVPCPLPAVPAFAESMMRWIGWTGRSYEPGLIAELEPEDRQHHQGHGPRPQANPPGQGQAHSRFRPLLASWNPAGHEERRVDRRVLPGCSLHSTSKDYEESVHASMEALGIKLEEPKGWVCCGSSAAHSVSHCAGFGPAHEDPGASARLRPRQGDHALPLLLLPPQGSIQEVESDGDLAQAVTRETGYAWDGQVSVETLVDTVVDSVGLDKVTASVKKPLAGLKVVCYYGCLMTRPPGLTGRQPRVPHEDG